MKRIILTLTLLPFMGCTHKTVQAPIPGALNAFDSSAYQTLRTAHDIAASFSAQACSNNGNKPGCFNPTTTEKATINEFIGDLNVADTVYAAYHNGAKTQAEAEAAINKVTADQAQLPSNLKGAK